MNLPSDQVVVNLTIWARSETVSDAAQQTIQVTLTKSVSEVTEEGDEQGFMQSATFKSIIYILLSIAILGVGAAGSDDTKEDEDDYIDERSDGYEDSVQATYTLGLQQHLLLTVLQGGSSNSFTTTSIC